MRKVYAIGTKVQERTGYVKVKITGDDGKAKWEGEARNVYKNSKGDLGEGDRVFHIDGDRENNKLSNLAKIHFSTTKFVMLKHSRVLYEPSLSKRRLTEDVLALARKRLQKV